MSFQFLRQMIGGAMFACALLAGASGSLAQSQPAANSAQFQVYRALMAQTVFSIQQKNWKAAIAFAKSAFRAANSDLERLDAARLAASAHFGAGQFSRAEWWLRRALNNATGGVGAQAVRQDFARVQQVNPLKVRLSFSAAPNNNINNGSSSESITIWNLPFILSPDAQALSGYEVSGSVDLRYRLAQSPVFATDIGLLLHGRIYELSGSAAAAAPAASGSDYAFSVVELLLSHTRNYPGLTGATSYSLNIGKNWYGGEPYTEYARITVAQQYRLSPTTGLNISGATEAQVSQRSGGVRSNIQTVSASLTHQLANRNRLGGSLRLQGTQSADPGAENIAIRLGLNYGLAQPILGMQLSFNMSAEQRDYDFSIYDITGRQDLTLSVGATALFTNISYFGFSPTMSLEANQTRSNVSLFDRETVALRFGIQSTF